MEKQSFLAENQGIEEKEQTFKIFDGFDDVCKSTWFKFV